MSNACGIALPRITRAGIGPVYCGECEILQRIFVTVRDAQWQEVPPAVTDAIVAESGNCVKLSARHTSQTVDFAWCGTLAVSGEHCALKFSLEGRALRDMQVCRVGLVILHSVASMVGAEISATGPQGVQRLRVPHPVTPQLLLDGLPAGMTEPFSLLTVERAGFGTLQLILNGDLFELEDQRNWGDASFKTYCTPLRLGFPRRIATGTQLAQDLEVRFRPSTGVAAPGRPMSQAAFPAIGAEPTTIDPGLWGLPWSHLHFRAPRLEAATALRGALSRHNSSSFELSIEPDAPDTLDARLVAVIAEHQSRIDRVLLCGAGVHLPTPEVLVAWREALGRAGAAHIPVLSSTRGYFADINRGLAASADSGVSSSAHPDGFAFPLSSTVHGDDPDIVIENILAVLDIAQTIRLKAPGSCIALAPLALYTGQSRGPGDFPPGLAAPWLVASLVQAAAAGIQTVTLSEDVLVALSIAGVARARDFFERLLRCVGAKASPVSLSVPARMHALCLCGHEPASRPMLLAANLSGQTVALPANADANPIDLVTGRSLPIELETVSLAPWQTLWACA